MGRGHAPFATAREGGESELQVTCDP
jgi:hypothetical protein